MKMSFFPWFFTITSLMIFCISTIIPVHSQCLEDQRSLLLQLKNSLEFDPPSSVKLVSWTQSNDCCQWKGVTCDQDGHVTGLDLNSESISGGISNSSSLFSLLYLEKLNLAYNSLSHWNANFTSFSMTQMPSGFGNLTNLIHLNLSEAGFAGQIPIELSHLTRLVTLDLSTDFQYNWLQLENPNLSTLLQNLTGLTQLHLDGVNISSQGSEWCQAISSSLPNLRALNLSSCYLSGPIDSSLQNLKFLSEIDLSYNNLSAPVPEFFVKFANLTALSLRYSNLYGRFPEKIFQMTNLQTLDLEGNWLSGSLPEFPQNGSIRILVLRDTSFSGRLPESLGNLTKLSTIDISRCNFSGPIPISLANLRQLVYLDLSHNNFSGPIPSFQSSKNLRYVDLSDNSLTGPIPSTHYEGLLNLEYVDLAYNSFNGSIPSSLFSLQSLEKIQLSNNKFDEVSGIQNGSLSPLDTLDLSSNKLKVPIPSYFFDFRELSFLSLSYNNFSGTVQLESIQRLQNLFYLDLSYNSLSVNASISNSSLSSFPQLESLRLASCKLQEFPPLENQTILGTLDLSNNQIYGEIPNWIWNVSYGILTDLNLSTNLLVELQRPYTIPSYLSFLDLHSNQLRGEIPIPPESAIYVDYSSNNFSHSIPAGIGNNLTSAYFFSLSNNSLTGAIPESICNVSNLQVLDLSNNRLSGTIPQCLIDSGTATFGVLNLQNNNLTGSIRGTFPEVCALETLDVNGNQLEGQVPKSLANCTNLEVLNLGNNKMNGNFPCFLKNSSSLRVFVLRSNKFQGSIRCRGIQRNIWPKLQIIDLALNNFSGDLPSKVFLHWKAMMSDGGGAQPDLNALRFEVHGNLYYQDRVTLTIKGRQIELVKILTIFTAIDLSSNNFRGEIPDTLGALESLHVLNLSHNALTGLIPSSLGTLSQLESLDLSRNKLSGSIPVQLASLTFLSLLNLSYNQLVGMIPRGPQFQTFTEASFQGNPGLYGPPLNACCGEAEPPGSFGPTADDVHSEINWVYISATLGYSMGFGVVVVPLFYCKRWRTWHDKHVDGAISRVLRLEDQQAGYQRNRENKNLVRRRQNR